MTPSAPLPPALPHRHLRDVLVLGALFALVLAGLLGLAAATGWDETWAQVARLHGWQIAALLGFSLVNYLMRGLRWHLFSRRLGLGLSLAADLRHFLAGFAMSVTPARVGELVRMRWIGRETGWPFERTAPMMLMDRASDLGASGLLLGLALAFAPQGIAFGVPVVAVSVVGAYFITRPGLIVALAEGGHRALGRFGRFFARVRRAAGSFARFSSPGLMAGALVLGLIGWGAEAVAFGLLLDWMGAEISMASAVAIFVFAGLAGGLTGAPGGVGGAEAAMVALLSLHGVGLEAAIPATALIRLTTLWFAIAIGLGLFPVAERTSLRRKHALENN